MEEKNLLIIDDEEQLLENLSFLLKKHAHQVFTATNGHDGLAILKRESIHCVICDISMPVMNGVEVIKAVRSVGNEVPFIFYTAFGNHDLMVEAAKYGAFDFLSKPIFEDLEKVVAHGLSEGFKRARGTTDDSRPSEYQKVIDELLKAVEGQE